MRYLKIFLLIVLIISAAAVGLSLRLPRHNEPRFTISFSAAQARYLGFSAEQMLAEILTDLKPAHLRLQADWDQIESKENQFTFSELDNLIVQIKESGATLTLAVGRKLPHWPECHDPSWLEQLKSWEIEEYHFRMVRRVIEHYRQESAITRWQLENEPLFAFGECPTPNWHSLRREVALVKSLDRRPILITDSGELSPWWETGFLADQQGATLYRTTWNKITGYFDYWLPPLFYRAKAALLSLLGKDVIISELQLEPWAPRGLLDLTAAETQKSLSLQKFQDNVDFFQATGLSEAIVWGVEWWYYKRDKGETAYWDLGRRLLFNSQ